MNNEEMADRGDLVLTRPGESLPAPGLSPDPAGPSSTEDYEELYQRIGRWKGPYGTREAQEKVVGFWLSQGDAGLRWLAGRLRREGHIDALDGTAALLSRAGESAILPILEELERRPSTDQAGALLKALAWIGEDGIKASPDLIARLEAAIRGYVDHGEADLREQAARSARLLAPGHIADLLGGRDDAEPDATVRESIREVLGAVAAGRG